MKKNFAYNLIYQVFTILMPLITAPYLSRIIGVEGMGMYSYTFTVAEYFVYFALLGVANYGNRTIAAASNHERSHIFINIYATQLTVSSVVILAYIVFSVFINNKYSLLTYIQIFYVVSAALDISWYFFGTEKFRLTTLRNVVVKLISMVAIFVFVRTAEDVWKYTLIMSLGYFFSQLIMWIYIKEEIVYEKPDLKKMGIHLKSMLILFIPVIAITLYKMMDKIMLEGMSSVVYVGFYDSAEKIVRVPSLVITALGVAMLPRMSKLGADGNKDKMSEYFGMSIELSGMLTSAMAFGVISIAEILVPVYYGPGFEEAVELMKILSLVLFFTSWANNIRTQYLLPLKHDKEYIMSVFAGAIINMVLNFIFIPRINAKGAVIATVVAEAIVAVVQTYGVRKEIQIKKYLVTYIKYLIPGGVMYTLLVLVQKNMGVSLFDLGIVVCCGIIVYAVMALILMKATQSKLLLVLLRMVKKI